MKLCSFPFNFLFLVQYLILFWLCLCAEVDGNFAQERLDKISRMTEIDDLRAPQDHPYAPLCIKVGLLSLCNLIFYFIIVISVFLKPGSTRLL